MCGRYYIESSWEGEIEDVVQDIDRRIRQEQFIAGKSNALRYFRIRHAEIL